MTRTGEFFAGFWREESGAAAAEYVLLLAIVGGGIAVTAAELGTAISDELSNTAACIADLTACPQ